MAHEYSSKVQTAYQISKKEILARAGFFGFAALAGNLSMVAVLGYGGTLTAANALSIGDLSAFLLYTAYAGMSISGLASFQAELMKGIGASTRLFGLLQQQPTVTGTGTIPDHEFNGHVEFRNVDFKYATRESTVITGLNLAVPAGTTHAVVGGSGSGKSTLFALLLRLYETDAGGVYIDGHNVKDLDPKWLREQIGTVEQNPVLFSGTVADNIRFGVAEASPDEIEAVARQAFAHEFIESFPDGYDTIVGERGVMLSGGQQQRIAIARAILKDPKILLLDEATSSLDTESEQYVQAALQRLMVDRTTLQIAHRLSTISGSHGVAVISDGAVAENGTYAELIGRKGAFYDLMRRQNLAT
jgi:ATP-binding cassette subfamily B (MDR/TAP) protein 10